jgi:chromosome segregation ATPase
VMTFFGRLMNKISLPVTSHRPHGSGARVYRVATVSSILKQIDTLDARKELLEAKIYRLEDKQDNLLNRREIQTKRYQQVSQEHTGIFPVLDFYADGLSSIECRLDRVETTLDRARERLAAYEARLIAFTRTIATLDVRVALFDGATRRLTAASTSLINKGDIGVVDEQEITVVPDRIDRQITLDFRRRA